MVPGSSKDMVMINNVNTTDAATANGYVDTQDFDLCVIDVILPTSNAVTNNPSVLKLGDATVTNVTSATDITDFVGDTAFTIPNCVTTADDDLFAKFIVDCSNLERYIHLEISPTTTQIITAVAHLYRGDATPAGTTAENCKVIVNGAGA